MQNKVILMSVHALIYLYIQEEYFLLRITEITRAQNVLGGMLEMAVLS